jgi:putative NIF3 family GTP cyclohydrolase 1 type 2
VQETRHGLARRQQPDTGLARHRAVDLATLQGLAQYRTGKRGSGGVGLSRPYHDGWQAQRAAVDETLSAVVVDQQLANRYLRAYEVEPQSAFRFAESLARRLAPLGQPGVQLLGPGDKKIARVGTGTGAITPVFEMLAELEVDAVIATDDGIDYWREGALAIDLEIPIFVVNHPVSELAGVESLADHLQTKYPDIPVHHIPQACMYVTIQPSR